jgi:signal transduction histidine kinase
MLIGVVLGAVIATVVCALVSAVVTRRLLTRARRAERSEHEARRLAQLGAMTGGLAHEIKNPLSTIGLNAQLIAEAIDELPIEEAERNRLSRRIDALRREAERLRDILEDFLRLAGSIQLDASRTDLNALVEELADFYAPQAASAGVRMRVELSDPPTVAWADAKHLKQAVLNLMLNAVQVMAGQRDEASAAQPPELILRTESSTEDGLPMAALHVIDTGPGIAKEKIEQIFSPYYSMRSGGAGLGLAITRRIVSEHGGRIEVHSEVGKGSDFAIILPVRAP